MIMRNSKRLKTDTKLKRLMEHFCWKNVILQKSDLTRDIVLQYLFSLHNCSFGMS